MSVINCEGDELLLFHVSVRKNTAFCWGSKFKWFSKSIFWPTPRPLFFRIASRHLSFRSVVVITCASHAQGRRFEPGRKQRFPVFSFHISGPTMRYSAGPRNVFQTSQALLSSVWRLFYPSTSSRWSARASLRDFSTARGSAFPFRIGGSLV